MEGIVNYILLFRVINLDHSVTKQATAVKLSKSNKMSIFLPRMWIAYLKQKEKKKLLSHTAYTFNKNLKLQYTIRIVAHTVLC